jgi:hypothetical protein
VRVYLFGYASDDFVGRQLVAWGLEPERHGAITVRNESGEILEPADTIAQAGLSNGAIFTVERG